MVCRRSCMLCFISMILIGVCYDTQHRIVLFTVFFMSFVGPALLSPSPRRSITLFVTFKVSNFEAKPNHFEPVERQKLREWFSGNKALSSPIVHLFLTETAPIYSSK